MSQAAEAIIRRSAFGSPKSYAIGRSGASSNLNFIDKSSLFIKNWSIVIISWLAPIPITILSAIIITALLGVEFSAFAAVFPPAFIIFELIFALSFFVGIMMGVKKAGRKIPGKILALFIGVRILYLSAMYLMIMGTVWVLSFMLADREGFLDSYNQLQQGTFFDIGLFLGFAGIALPVALRLVDPYLPSRADTLNQVGNKN